ncbi:MAG TPA: pilin [Candidatus Eisenbacteria bacterium]|nr:pilin [Candidatus Eisenbacteria bacterium]
MSPLLEKAGVSGSKAMAERQAGAARRIAMAIVAGFFLLSVRAVSADVGDVYSPCWGHDECLDVNVGGTPTAQPNRGQCDNQHCFEQGAGCPGGQGKCYANPPPVPLTVTIGSKARVIDVGDYIASVYNYGVSIVAMIAGVVFVVAGFQYLTAGGDAGRVSKAKERIRDALVGLLLTLGAYVILNTVNPDVLRLQMPKVPLVKKVLFVACQYFERQVPCGQPFTLVKRDGVSNDAAPETKYRLAEQRDLEGGSGVTTTQCIGKSCSRAGSDDASFRCKRPPGSQTSAPATNSAAPGSSGINIVAPDACLSAPVAPFQCLPCQAEGADCRGAGPSTECCGGFCGSADSRTRAATGSFGAAVGSSGYSGTGSSLFQGTCSNGSNGTRCAVDAECFSHHCADIHGQIGGTCTSGRESAACDDDADCEGGRVCIEMTGIHVCSTPWYLSACDGNSDCGGTGLTCQRHRCVPPNYGSFGVQPCSDNSGCSEAVMAGGTREIFGNEITLPDNSRWGPMFCWTQASHVFSADTMFCKPRHDGVVCHVGESECGGSTNCVDGAINDHDWTGLGTSAGICTSAGQAGNGCDPGVDNQCRGPNRSNAKCESMPHWLIDNTGICTYDGNAGAPCIPEGDQGTCNSGLRCPANVKVCVEPPGCPSH